MTTADAAIAAAYSVSATAWRDGPAAIYDRLADVLVARSPVSLCGADVVDIGAGTGAASFAGARAGARFVVAVDNAAGMLHVDSGRRPPSLVASALCLPFVAGAFDVALAAFSFNHVDNPAAAFTEAARVVRRGGAVLAAVYAADDTHPVKAAVEHSLREHGWGPESWLVEMHDNRAPRLATVEACTDVLRSTGLHADVATERVDFADLEPRQLVAWRLGMAQHAPFVRTLSERHREAVVRDALDMLGDDAPPLVRSIIVATIRC